MSLSFRSDKMSLPSAWSLFAASLLYVSMAPMGIGSHRVCAQDATASPAEADKAAAANNEATGDTAPREAAPSSSGIAAPSTPPVSAAAEPPRVPLNETPGEGTPGEGTRGEGTRGAPRVVTREPASSTASIAARELDQARYQFNFSGADWRMVLEWLAGEGGLSLQMDRVPGGTVNYIDPSRTYTLRESMDIVNQLLLKTGFALVRRGQLLMLIDLEAENAAGLISEVAELVTPDELSMRADSDIVRCVFPLGGVSPEIAKTEIAQMIGPAGRAIVLDSSKQVVVTETVGKLKAIRTLLENAATSGSEITEIVLKHRVADEILEIARPLLGLEPGMNSNESIRIATGLYGDRLYATGQPLQCALLQGIVERADTPLQVPASTAGDASALPKLETYAISNVDPATVIDVLQTLLAGIPDTRIATDPQSRGVIAYARPDTHALIRQTIDKLEGKGSTFEVIQLRRLEPSQALLTINKFFGITAENAGDGPTVDGDPVTGKLWVRGTPEQIQLIHDLLDRLEGADSMGAMGDRVRLLPYTGRSAEQTLEQLQMLWEVTGRTNKIRMVTPSGQTTPSVGSAGGISFPQRRIAGDRMEQPQQGAVAPEASQPAADNDASGSPRQPSPLPFEAREIHGVPEAARMQKPSYQLVVQQTDSRNSGDTSAVDETSAAALNRIDADDIDDKTAQRPKPVDDTTEQSGAGGDIVISMTPSGMIVASDDPQALADFEEMMRTLADQTSLGGAQPTVFWLKYAKAQEAADLATKILGGGDTSSSSLGSSGGSVLSELGGGMLGGLLGFGGGGSSSTSAGPVLTTTGSVSIIPDGRLNALIVQANAIDMRMVEMVLEVIDREESPEDVQTTAKPQLIPVIYQDASEVATIIKGIYAERTADQNASRRQPSPEDFINALRGGGSGGRGGRGGSSEDQGSKPTPINVAVDARSNSLIVSAPPQDVADIRALVEAIDAGGMESEETVEIVSLHGNMKADVVQKALESVLGTQAKTTSTTSPSSSSPTASGGGSSSDDIERRMEFFRSLRGGGSPFGGGGSPFGGGGGGSPFGGGGSPGSSPFGGRGGFGGFGGSGVPGGGGGADRGGGDRGGGDRGGDRGGGDRGNSGRGGR